MIKLYLVSTDDSYYNFICKAKNKKEAINLIYEDWGLLDDGYFKKDVDAIAIDDKFFDMSDYRLIF